MATFYPIKIGDFRFFVNPTKIKIEKKSQIQELRTMGGTVFQVWPDLPDEVSLEGMSYGYRSIAELRGLERQIRNGGGPSSKMTTLSYKNKTYQIYIRSLTVEADAENPRQFTYSLSFVSKTPFDVSVMPLGQLPGIKAEFDFQAAQLRTATEAIANLPEEVLNNIGSVYAQIFGASGATAAEHGLGIFIGRPRGTLFSRLGK